MKMKFFLLTLVAFLGLATTSIAQNNCNLINSATFSAPNSTQSFLGFQVACVNNNNPPNNAGTNVNVSLPINQWSYVALTKSSTNACNLYLNGQIIFTGNYANISYNWIKFVLGAQPSGSTYTSYFNGLIDEVRISNSTRTASEISNYYNSNLPFTADVNTIGLWHFDQSSGTTVNGTIGGNGTTNAVWTNGIFGNALQYNGSSTHSDFNFTTPTSNNTIEFWIKPNSIGLSWPIFTGGNNSAGLLLNPYTTNVNYTWSTGATGNSVTVNPSTLPYIWVTDGNCTDTIWFDSQSATVYDTTFIAVTDTLLINTAVTGINPPNNVNTIKVYPNPASTHITIDYGNFAIMNGYQLRIQNSLGQQVFQTNINQQSDYLDLSTWGGNGIYFVNIIDPQGNIIDIKKIVLQ